MQAMCDAQIRVQCSLSTGLIPASTGRMSWLVQLQLATEKGGLRKTARWSEICCSCKVWSDASLLLVCLRRNRGQGNRQAGLSCIREAGMTAGASCDSLAPRNMSADPEEQPDPLSPVWVL